jgi:hypothetical protein
MGEDALQPWHVLLKRMERALTPDVVRGDAGVIATGSAPDQ